MRVRAVALLVAVSGPALAGCGGQAARDPTATPNPAGAASVAPVRLSTAPGSCAVVVDRTLRAITVRIEARAALHRRRAARPPTLVATLTRPAPRACAATTARTVANTVGAVGERLVRAEANGSEVARALALVARDPAFVRAVRRRDATGLRAAIVRVFRIRRLHIVRVRATTAQGRLVGDVGGPYVLAPASRTIRGARGRVLGRVTLSVQDDAGYIKLMRRFTGAGVVLRTATGIVPGSATAPAATRASGARFATFAFRTRAFPAGRLDVTLLVPLTKT
jgi:hypothetical protein